MGKREDNRKTCMCISGFINKTCGDLVKIVMKMTVMSINTLRIITNSICSDSGKNQASETACLKKRRDIGDPDG